MRRSDLLVGTAVALLTAFVGRAVWHARAQQQDVDQRTASFGTARPDTGEEAVRDTGASLVFTGRSSDAGAPTGSDILRRLELSGHDTYIGEVIAAHDSALVRWPDRTLKPLRVWVQPLSPLPAFRAEYVPIVRRAFNAWADVGIPIAFTFVVDSGAADIHITWVDQFNDAISGKTIWAHDEARWIVDAQIQLAVRHQGGDMLDSTAIAAISLHEIGHLLGLDHTSDTTSIMASKVRVRRLSPADRATVQLLYRLPAGKIGR